MKQNKGKQEIDILAGKHYQKSNALVNSKGRASLIAQKLFAIGIQQAIEDEKSGVLTTTLKGTDLRKIFNKKNGSFYDQIKEAVTPVQGRQSLLDYRVVFTDDTTKKVEAINVITDCNFENGVLEIRFNNKINDQIHELKANYTVFSLSETMPLKHVYSFKLYEILKAEYDRQDYIAKKNGTKIEPNPTYIMEIDLVDLKLRLGIIDPSANDEILKAVKQSNPNYNKIDSMAADQDDYKKYSDFAAFRRAALDKPQKELKEHTSICFDYDPIRTGRGGKTTAIRFFISKNIKEDEVVDSKAEVVEETANTATEVTEADVFRITFKAQAILGIDFEMEDVISITKAANYDLSKIKAAHDLMLKSKTDIDNPTAWMISAIKENYKAPKAKKTANKFTDFNQNSYDFDELEKQLVDN